MKILLLRDKDIDTTQLAEVQRQLNEMYLTNAGITLEWAEEVMDYSEYPVEEYAGHPGCFGIQKTWLKAKCADVYTRWREEVDQVVFLINSTNWRLDGVWGWNISKVYSGYGVQQVRFADNSSHTAERNINNSIGTLYHELMHDHDMCVYTYLGLNVEPLVGVSDWDHEVVHGNSEQWTYIRYKENLEALRKIGFLLRDAITKRRALFIKHTDLQRQVIQLLEQKAMLLRQLIAQQRGDIALLENNKCSYGKDK